MRKVESSGTSAALGNLTVLSSEPTKCICMTCGRRYDYDARCGHTLLKCNSCRSNRAVDRVELKRRMVEYKGGGCCLCGYDRCLQALDFHHLDPRTKKFSIAGSHTRSWESLRQELDKCMLVCSNCHFEIERTAIRTQRTAPRSNVTAEAELMCVCRTCGRQFVYDRRKGHTRGRCNSCGSNRAKPAERHELKRWMTKLGGGCCRLCGYSRSIHALTFHHIEPARKAFHISGAHSRSLEALRAELTKCILVCANCHDEIEAGATHLPASLVADVRRATAHLPAHRRRGPGRPRN